MNLLDLNLGAPAENLAADEWLLDSCESGEEGEVLRIWEASTRFVVLGYANRAGAEVNLEACEALGVPVLRRCSGGGTVVQGAGCLNYALVLRVDRAPELASVTATNAWIMERNARAIGGLLGREVSVEGVTDLAVAGRKFSGNAQRRRQRSLLFHGTILHSFEIECMDRILRVPTRAPAYRSGRSHGAFVRNIPVTAEAVRGALAKEWAAEPGSATVDRVDIARRVEERYGNAAWNLRL
jgi:lipoate-protein ligase A